MIDCNDIISPAPEPNAYRAKITTTGKPELLAAAICTSVKVKFPTEHAPDINAPIMAIAKAYKVYEVPKYSAILCPT